MVNPRLNELLDQLPQPDLQTLSPYLTLVSLVADQVLCDPGEPIETIYFPVNALVAIATVLSDGNSVDTALIGADGLVGLKALDPRASSHRCHITGSGLTYRIARSDLMREAHSSVGISRMCIKAGIQMVRKMSLEVACIHFHSLEQRLAKWLLIRLDHGSLEAVRTTHQAIADSLGVRREGITIGLQRLGGIGSRRGCVEIHDRSLLETYSCECYGLQRDIHPHQLQLPFQCAA